MARRTRIPRTAGRKTLYVVPGIRDQTRPATEAQEGGWRAALRFVGRAPRIQ